MMARICDICKKLIISDDTRVSLEIVDFKNGAEVLHYEDLCPECKEAIQRFIIDRME